MKLIFLDESGTHNLRTIDPQYPIFVLGGVIVEEGYLNEVIQPDLDAFKHELFGSKDLIVHTSDLSRNRNGFEKLKDAAFRKAFYEHLNTLMRTWDYKVVACVVKKDAHFARYGMDAIDPYLLSLNHLIERFCWEIGDVKQGGTVVVEARGHPLDRQLELAWINLKIQGTDHLRASEIVDRIKTLTIQEKSLNLAGLQLADLVVTPIGRHILGKPSHEDFRIIESKFRRVEDSYQDAGLVIVPN